MRRFMRWVFEDRQTGAITIAQAPNLTLWIFIVASLAGWLLHPVGRLAAAIEIVAKGALVLWALDEILRGVNPWRRCLGVAVLCYWVATLPR